VDNLALNSADESLADLQPEDSEGEEEEEERAPLTSEQKKLEFMAALGLVPPAVLEGNYSYDSSYSLTTL